MIDDADDTTRAAIRAVADVPAPPVTTTLDTVIRRGRHRTLVQRGATVAAVAGVVAAIGVGGVLLRSAAEGQGARPAGPPVSTTAPTSVPTTPSQTLVPSSSVPATPQPGKPLPGWGLGPAPIAGDGYCRSESGASTAADLPLPNQDKTRDVFIGAVRTQFGSPPQLVDQNWDHNSPNMSKPRGYLEVNVDMGDGPGAVQLEVESYDGDPQRAADADVAADGNCARPMRTTIEGAVLQLYPPDVTDKRFPSQHLRVYLPGGRRYIVTTAGYGETDKTTIPGVGYTIESGRGRLPLDDAGLAEVGLALTAFGK